MEQIFRATSSPFQNGCHLQGESELCQILSVKVLTPDFSESLLIMYLKLLLEVFFQIGLFFLSEHIHSSSFEEQQSNASSNAASLCIGILKR